MAESNEWAIKAAVALRGWLDENNYQPRNKLADKLQIPRKYWGRLIAGENIPEDDEHIEYYARIYLFTGIAETDPRTIDPRLYKTKTGTQSFKDRAWTNDTYEKWLQKQHIVSPNKAFPLVKPVIKPSPKPSVLPSLTVEDQARRLVQAIRSEMSGKSDHFEFSVESAAQNLVGALKRENERNTNKNSTPSEFLIDDLLQQTLAELKLYMKTDAQSRDQLVARNDNVMREIWLYLSTYIAPRDEREGSIRLKEDWG